MALNCFDKHGVYVRPPEDQIATLDEASLVRFNKLDALGNALAAKEAELKVALVAIGEAVEKLDAEQKALDALPKPTFHDLWKQSTSRPDKSLSPVNSKAPG